MRDKNNDLSNRIFTVPSNSISKGDLSPGRWIGIGEEPALVSRIASFKMDIFGSTLDNPAPPFHVRRDSDGFVDALKEVTWKVAMRYLRGSSQTEQKVAYRTVSHLVADRLEDTA